MKIFSIILGVYFLIAAYGNGGIDIGIIEGLAISGYMFFNF